MNKKVCDGFNPQDGPLVLEPGPVFAKDGDKNRSEQISYRILRGLNATLFKLWKLLNSFTGSVHDADVT